MEQLKAFLGQEVVAGWSLQSVALGVVGVAAALWIFRWVMTPKVESHHIRKARCHCGWKGQTSVHVLKCPKCGARAQLE